MTTHPILIQSEWAELIGVMGGDSHSCHNPTHILRDDQGKIAGAFSTSCAPVLFFWLQSTRRNPIAAAHAYALVEQAFKKLGHHHILLYLEKSSPFYPYLTKVGYCPLGEVTAFTKELAN